MNLYNSGDFDGAELHHYLEEISSYKCNNGNDMFIYSEKNKFH